MQSLNHKRKGQRPRRGLSLIECLIASVVLVFGSTATLYALSSSIQQQQYAQEQKTAVRLATQLMEQAVAEKNADTGSDTTQEDTGELGLGLTVGGLLSTGVYVDLVDDSGFSLDDGGGIDSTTTLEGYTRRVYLEAADLSASGQTAVADVLVVEVTGPSGRTFTLRQLVPRQ